MENIILSSESIQSSYDGTELVVHTWTNKSISSTKGTEATSVSCLNSIAIIYHGFLAHAQYPTVRYAAELLVGGGDMGTDKALQPTVDAVVSADMRGHGQSGGLDGYFPCREVVVNDAIQVLRYTIDKYCKIDRTNVPNQELKIFLVGSSMGGTIALTVATEFFLNPAIDKSKDVRQNANDNAIIKECRNYKIAGVVLLAPMLKLKVDVPVQYLLSVLAFIIPTLSIIPSSTSDSSKQYRDENKRAECSEDGPSKARNNSKTIRVGSASTCVELTTSIQQMFSKIQVPFLLMIADDDFIVQPDQTLYDMAPSNDKTLKRYPALHGLLCESQPLLGTIQKDLVQWISERS